MTMNRRNLLFCLSGAIAAPMVVRTPGLLMPIKVLPKSLPELWKKVVLEHLSFTKVRDVNAFCDLIFLNNGDFTAAQQEFYTEVRRQGYGQMVVRSTDMTKPVSFITTALPSDRLRPEVPLGSIHAMRRQDMMWDAFVHTELPGDEGTFLEGKFIRGI